MRLNDRMHRSAVILITLLSLCGPAIAAEKTPAAPEPATRDYKNRPDPCEVKQHKKQPVPKGAAAATKPADTQKP